MLEQVLAVAKAQKNVIWCILASLGGYACMAAFIAAGLDDQSPIRLVFLWPYTHPGRSDGEHLPAGVCA